MGDGGNKNDIGVGQVSDWYNINEGGKGQDIRQNLLGSILRIDINSGSPYGVPSDNPFAENQDDMKEIYAYGLRNPYRFSIDSKTGMIIAAYVGQVLSGQINVIRLADNYGWNLKEGTLCLNAADNKNPLPECPDQTSLGNKFVDLVIEFKKTYPIQRKVVVKRVSGAMWSGKKNVRTWVEIVFLVSQHQGNPNGVVFAAKVGG